LTFCKRHIQGPPKHKRVLLFDIINLLLQQLLSNLFFVKKIWMLFCGYFGLLLESIQQDDG